VTDSLTSALARFGPISSDAVKPIYNWFHEDFGTSNHVVARAPIDES
jgi:hypothetical protein